jgi:hypothetical protein
MILTRILLLTALAAAPSALLHAQGSYEIQVYGSDLVDPGATMFELHSNFTFEGSKTVVDGQYPTEHQLHETLEITHGFNDWFELGFLRFYERGFAGRVAMGGRSHQAARGGSEIVELAGGGESLDGSWLSARGVFAGHMDD